MTPTERDATRGLLQAVFDVLPVGIGLLDAGGALILANPAMRRFMPAGVLPSLDEARYGRCATAPRTNGAAWNASSCPVPAPSRR